MTIHTNQFQVKHQTNKGTTIQVNTEVYQYLLQTIAENAIDTAKTYEVEDIEILNISSKDTPCGELDIMCNVNFTSSNFTFCSYGIYRFDCNCELINIDMSISKKNLK